MADDPKPVYGVVLLHRTSAALRSEMVLLAAGLTVRLIPVPREVSSNCGISVRFLWTDRAIVDATLSDAGIDVDAIHRLP